MQSPPEAPDQNAPTVQERALAILREFELAQAELKGQPVVLSDCKAGTVEKVKLDELHGLRVAVVGHDVAGPYLGIDIEAVRPLPSSSAISPNVSPGSMMFRNISLPSRVLALMRILPVTTP